MKRYLFPLFACMLTVLAFLSGCGTAGQSAQEAALDFNSMKLQDFAVDGEYIFPKTKWGMTMEEAGTALGTTFSSQEGKKVDSENILEISKDCTVLDKTGLARFSFRDGKLWMVDLSVPTSQFENLQESFDQLAKSLTEAHGKPQREYLSPEGTEEKPVTHEWMSTQTDSRLVLTQVTSDDWKTVSALRILFQAGDNAA